MLVAETHPYYPVEVPMLNYRPNSQPLGRTLPLFGSLCGAVVLIAHLMARRAQLRGRDSFAAPWFALCRSSMVIFGIGGTGIGSKTDQEFARIAGFLHVIFEGYYVLHHDTLAGENSLLAQVWKEYALSDSRYLVSDTFTLCIETITVLAWGPLSILTFLAIISKSPAPAARHVLQIAVCTAHLYGLALYYATVWAEHRLHGASYSRPEFLYYWVYFVGFNMPWAVVPLFLLKDSYGQITRAFRALEKGKDD